MQNSKFINRISEYRYFIVFIMLYTTLCTLIIVGLTTLRLAERQTEFNRRTVEEVIKMETEMDNYNNILFTLRSILTTDKDLTITEWDNHMESMAIETRYPDVLAIGYLHKVPLAEVDGYQEKLNLLYQNSKITHKIYPTEKYEQNYIFTYAYPSLENRRTVGLNPTGSKERFEAIHKAIRTGNSTATIAVDLLDKNISLEKSIIIYLPIYKYLKPVTTEQERIENIRGVVALTFPLKHMIQTFYSNYQVAPDIHLEISDITDLQNPNVIYTSMEHSTPGNGFTHSIDIDFSQRNWRLTFHAPIGYQLQFGGLFTFIFLIILLLVFGILMSYHLFIKIGKQLKL